MTAVIARPIAEQPFAVAGYHTWRDLLFLHWPVPAAEIQRLLPARLSVATFDGWAWVGVVAFDLHGVRPWWFPAVPGVSAFPEINVRTYVQSGEEEPRVWFFSLDANASLAVRVARWRWHLNYFRSTMTIARDENRISYNGRRLWPGELLPDFSIAANIGAPLTGIAESRLPDTLEHFLIDRYHLDTQRRDGMLMTSEVRHESYRLREVEVTDCRESLTLASGLEVHGPPSHAVFSEGVDVAMGRLQPLAD